MCCTALGQHTEWATTGREVAEVDAEGDTNSIAVGNSRDCALDVSAGILGVEELGSREGSSIDDSWRVVLDDGSVAKNSSDRDTGGLGADKSKERGHQDQEQCCETHVGGGIVQLDCFLKGDGRCIPVSTGFLEEKK